MLTKGLDIAVEVLVVLLAAVAIIVLAPVAIGWLLWDRLRS